jgi:hypothetical protein
MIGFKNSASIKLTFKTKIELPKKVDPIPINISLNKNPINIDPIDNINNGNDIFIGDSCACTIVFCGALVSVMNVKYINLNE